MSFGAIQIGTNITYFEFIVWRQLQQSQISCLASPTDRHVRANFTVEGLHSVFLICLFWLRTAVYFCTFSKQYVRRCFKFDHFPSIASTCTNVSQPSDISTQIWLPIVRKRPSNQTQVNVLAATSVFFHS